MSVVRKTVYTLACDKCGQVIDFGDYEPLFGSPTEAANGARSAGWECTNGKHYCEDCLPCPTCSGPIRETVGLVCQTCGTDYGGAAGGAS